MTTRLKHMIPFLFHMPLSPPTPNHGLYQFYACKNCLFSFEEQWVIRGVAVALALDAKAAATYLITPDNP